jgi:hypothetical protein
MKGSGDTLVRYPRPTIGPSIRSSPTAPIGSSLSWSLGSTIQQRVPNPCPILRASRFRASPNCTVDMAAASEGPSTSELAIVLGVCFARHSGNLLDGSEDCQFTNVRKRNILTAIKQLHFWGPPRNVISTHAFSSKNQYFQRWYGLWS